MAIGRALSGAIRGVVALAVGVAILIPVGVMLAAAAIPVLIVLAVSGAIGAVALFSVGIPALIVVVLAMLAIGSIFALAGGLFALGVLALKILLFAMALSWLFRKFFVRRVPAEPVLVGAPIADISAPRRDKYDIAAERELDEELGL